MNLNTTIKFKLSLGIASQVVIILLIIGTMILIKMRFSGLTNSNTQVFAESKALQKLAFDMKDYFNNNTEYATIKTLYDKSKEEVTEEELPEGLLVIISEIEKIENINAQNEELENKFNQEIDSSLDYSSKYISNNLRTLAKIDARYSVSTADRLLLIHAYNQSIHFQELKNKFNLLKKDLNKQEEYQNYLLKTKDSFDEFSATNKGNYLATSIEKSKESLQKIESLSERYISNLIKKNEIKQLAAESTDNLFIILNQGNIDNTEQGLNNLRKITQIAFFILIAFSIFIILLNGIISFSVNTFMTRMSYFLTEVGKGNLSLRVGKDVLARKDEFGKMATLLHNTTKKLSETLTVIKTGSNRIADVSFQLSSSSQQISQGATEQASSIEEVSAAMEEMVANIEQNNDNANQTQTIAGQSAEAMRAIGNSSKESLDSVTNIASKISIVNDIAFQTNILALNAAVEAARAGEHGKGFAVVAAEVRKLAERSKVAANEIDSLTKNSVKSTEEARSQMEIMIPEIVKTSQLVEEIASSSAEQKTGSDQINNALQQLNGVTQENASSSEELACSAEELSVQAKELLSVIDFFKFEEKSNQETHLSKSSKNSKKTDKNSQNKPIQKERMPAPQFKPAEESLSESGINFDLGNNISDTDFERF